MLPAKSTPAAHMISLVGKTARVASPAATIAAAPVPRGLTSTLIISVMPSRGKRSVVSQIPLVLPGTATVLALSRTCLKASTVLTSGFGAPSPHRHADGYSRKIDVRSRDDSLRGDQ